MHVYSPYVYTSISIGLSILLSASLCILTGWQVQQQRVNYSQKCFILLTGVDLYIVTNTREKGLHDTPTPVTNIINLFTLVIYYYAL
jgi:hypothetical protein